MASAQILETRGDVGQIIARVQCDPGTVVRLATADGSRASEWVGVTDDQPVTLVLGKLSKTSDDVAVVAEFKAGAAEKDIFQTPPQSAKTRDLVTLINPGMDDAEAVDLRGFLTGFVQGLPVAQRQAAAQGLNQAILDYGRKRQAAARARVEAEMTARLAELPKLDE